MTEPMQFVVSNDDVRKLVELDDFDEFWEALGKAIRLLAKARKLEKKNDRA